MNKKSLDPRKISVMIKDLIVDLIEQLLKYNIKIYFMYIF